MDIRYITDLLEFENGVVRVAYDINLMQPGCVNVAAGLGASTRVPGLFPSELWLLAPTEHVKVYPTTSEQLISLIDKTLEFHGIKE